ncbi:tRNA lysidine(34) synthetase TilS [Thalassobius vesicularis]|uniref:tRNA(Ile)-lysidine synthase n=1 Tax=Thalassobius vesicularis TaxID=1294297 RepID=A0A4S3M9S3_9RHOB|nr:tRNA lysidine(34) synthetase TilS [Thalassobius vesicularis]THD72914.1 tRNA lysidine(34) synthetase TilS [Thalassobius vesicularis]
MTPEAAIADFLNGFSHPKLGLAVSGGGDSIAMLHLAAQGSVPLLAVTVDHGLRPEAADEARFVASVCVDLGVPHWTLRWRGWDGHGNLQDQARRARYQLIAEWARAQGVGHVALAHTLDDQAETFLMRLARSSGVDGLSEMTARQVDDVTFVRPLLGVSRADLRQMLKQRGADWVEDPSNHDPHYDRVKVRQHLVGLTDLGITAKGIADTSAALAQAREALNWAAHGFAAQHMHMVGPDVTIDIGAFADLPAELQRRLLVHVLRWLSGAEYSPRRQAVADLIQTALDGGKATLHGCAMSVRKGRIWLFREYAAVQSTSASVGHVWDNRFVISGPATNARIAALGAEGLQQLPNWRASGRPAAAVMADPAVWLDDRVIAAPLIAETQGWRAEPAPGRTDCHSALLTH